MSLHVDCAIDPSGCCLVGLQGRLDTHTSPLLASRLAALDPQRCTVQVLNLQKVDYISSAGVRCIFHAKKSASAAGACLLLIHLQPKVRKVLDIIKAIPEDHIFSSWEALEEYLVVKPSYVPLRSE